MTQRPSLVQALVLPLVGLFLIPSAVAIDLDTTNVTSIVSTAQKISSSLIANFHDASSTRGDFTQPEPWFWWLSGSGWTGLMEYAVFTNDTTHNAALLEALADNVGENYDFAPAAQASWEASDDQAYWLYSALTALEYNFEALPCIGADTGTNGTCANSWLSLAANVFDVYTARWAADNGTCGGGLKWQYNPSHAGFFYKNSVTNGGFFQVAARLARYTGEAVYAEWAVKIWDWTSAVGLISPTFNVYDGASDKETDNCLTVNAAQYSYNVATYMHGAAHMYALTGDERWEERVKGLVGAAKATFFSPPPAGTAEGVMYEQICELDSSCGTDQTSFKSSLARWMGKTAVLVPSVSDEIMGLLATSAEAAAASCTDGTSGNVTCGMKWWSGGYDGISDFGSMLSALEVVQNLLVANAPELAKLTV